MGTCAVAVGAIAVVLGCGKWRVIVGNATKSSLHTTAHRLIITRAHQHTLHTNQHPPPPTQARGKAAAAQQEQLRALSADEALKSSNQQLQEEVAELQQQLDAATALQRSTQVCVGVGVGV